MPFNIRTARPADTTVIADFNRRLAEETESKVLDPATVLAGVTALIDDAAHGQYYVADAGGDVIGQLLITYEWSDWRNGQFWWIQSVYVSPAHRRRGIFKALFDHVSALARANPMVCGIRLYVDEHNAQALATYGALGFSSPGYRVLEVELG
ncbi:MAG TPA: GNAT family N-acetyltransferase [Gammaproteobacteria bacterium]|nr:GNAT family N-acetyltransferase [Gammaproteobacteria bacterium]